MKLEVGMYIRTKKGSIAKILGIDWLFDGGGSELSNIEAIYFDNVIDGVDKDIYTGCMYLLKDCKSSFNIIDLIEEGDYVNGYKVFATDTAIGCIGELANENYLIYCFCDETFKNEDITEILTKEQYNANIYKL